MTNERSLGSSMSQFLNLLVKDVDANPSILIPYTKEVDMSLDDLLAGVEADDDDYVQEYCAQIDRSIEQLDNDFANHQATLEAIKEGYEYEENTEYSTLPYLYSDY